MSACWSSSWFTLFDRFRHTKFRCKCLAGEVFTSSCRNRKAICNLGETKGVSPLFFRPPTQPPGPSSCRRRMTQYNSTALIIDDADTNITYSNGWVHETGGTYMGTKSGAAGAGLTATIIFNGMFRCLFEVPHFSLQAHFQNF